MVTSQQPGRAVSGRLGWRLVLLGGWLLGAAPAGAANAPTVTAGAPSEGPFTGGTAVTITGTGFVVARR